MLKFQWRNYGAAAAGWAQAKMSPKEPIFKIGIWGSIFEILQERKI
jgi:hypothetical protein